MRLYWYIKTLDRVDLKDMLEGSSSFGDPFAFGDDDGVRI